MDGAGVRFPSGPQIQNLSVLLGRFCFVYGHEEARVRSEHLELCKTGPSAGEGGGLAGFASRQKPVTAEFCECPTSKIFVTDSPQVHTKKNGPLDMSGRYSYHMSDTVGTCMRRGISGTFCNVTSAVVKKVTKNSSKAPKGADMRNFRVRMVRKRPTAPLIPKMRIFVELGGLLNRADHARTYPRR